MILLQKTLLYCYALSHVVFTQFEYKHLQRRERTSQMNVKKHTGLELGYMEKQILAHTKRQF